MSTFRIKKGNHYSLPLALRPLFFLKRIRMCWRVKLSENCWYNADDIKIHGINKVCGIGFGFSHHKDSIRLGYQPDFRRPGVLRYYAYWYQHGRRYYAEIACLSVWEEFFFEIRERTDGLFCLTISNNKIHFEYFLLTQKSKFGYMLKPYFGGQSPAPWNVSMSVQKI